MEKSISKNPKVNCRISTKRGTVVYESFPLSKKGIELMVSHGHTVEVLK